MEELKLIIDQSIKEAHLSGIQSGKVENSNLVDDIIHKLETKIDSSVEFAVKKYVNGKIDNLNAKIDNYIEEDTKWKETASPYVKSVQEFVGFSKVGGIIMKGLLLVGGAVGVIAAFINYLKE
jgi:hypothetical protein